MRDDIKKRQDKTRQKREDWTRDGETKDSKIPLKWLDYYVQEIETTGHLTNENKRINFSAMI